MAKPIPTESENDIVPRGVKVVTSAGKVTRIDSAQLRSITHDVTIALAGAFGGQRLVQLFEDLVAAECVTNGGKRIPDNRTRLAASIYLANQIIGTPIQRSESVSVNLDADSAAGLEDRLRKSPALRATFRRILDATEDGAPQHVVGWGVAESAGDSESSANAVEHP